MKRPDVEDQYTPNEPWTLTLKSCHPYEAACEWALMTLGTGFGGRSVLVVGSPPAEAEALRLAKWNVTYTDWRMPPPIHDVTTQGHVNAMAMPFAGGAFEALTSTCVLCHVGIGRYNDPMAEAGDVRMLGECRRVLKPGSVAALMPGPVYEGEGPLELGIRHRVTTVEAFQALAEAAGFEVVETKSFRPTLFRWLDFGDRISPDPERPDYLCASLRAI